MKEYIEERVLELANYIIEKKTTVRNAAKKFGISKSTVHKDVTIWKVLKVLKIAVLKFTTNFVSCFFIVKVYHVAIKNGIHKRRQSMASAAKVFTTESLGDEKYVKGVSKGLHVTVNEVMYAENSIAY